MYKMSYQSIIRPLLFRVDPEKVHNYTLFFLSNLQNSNLALNLIKKQYSYSDECLEQNLFGKIFKNPVGIAAGFDKNAKVIKSVEALGFGHIEVGGITPEKQKGNKKPRMRRLPKCQAIINRLGFNNIGADKIGERLSSYDSNIPIGINLGEKNTENNNSYSKTALETIKRINRNNANYDWITLNVSCPNVGDRSLYKKDNLEKIIAEIDEKIDNTPLLIKVPPDLSNRDIQNISDIANKYSLDGITATNTIPTSNVENKKNLPEGGLSGRPLKEKATETIRNIYKNTNGEIPIIGVGGISDIESAWNKILAGSSIIQIYTGFIYKGPSIAKKINKGIKNKLDNENFNDITEAIGYNTDI